jgi:hypothetical protein
MFKVYINCHRGYSTAPRSKSGGGLAAPENFVFSGKILIIKEKFWVFFVNLGIRGKICNILFKKCVCRETFFVIGPEKFFQRLFCMWPECDGGGEKILIPPKNLSAPK